MIKIDARNGCAYEIKCPICKMTIMAEDNVDGMPFNPCEHLSLAYMTFAGNEEYPRISNMMAGRVEGIKLILADEKRRWEGWTEDHISTQEIMDEIDEVKVLVKLSKFFPHCVMLMTIGVGCGGPAETALDFFIFEENTNNISF